jgi:glycosyltransferase involved in cell wall biosynthesis
MEKRLKVLISAYACEPGKGSEPEVGWQWAVQMSRFHDITVLTRANNRPSIEGEISKISGPTPEFVYFDLAPLLLRMKKQFRMNRAYYVWWQRAARRRVAELVQRETFDLLHHVTFATFRYETAIWSHNIPCIWGPVGGVESIPAALLPWRYPGPLFSEIIRNLDNLAQRAARGVLRNRAKSSNLVLVSTRQMRDAFSNVGVSTELMPTIGLKTATFPVPTRSVSIRPLRLLYVGNLIPLKGLDFGLKALKVSGTNARLTLIGSGPFRKHLEELTEKLGLKDHVEFRGRVPREQALMAYKDFDVCLFPSLHDTGGYTVIEAMCNAMPTICLAAGGPETALQHGGGMSVPLGSRAGVVRGLAEAIRLYDADRERVLRDGQVARRSVELNYDWAQKAQRMHEFYLKAVDGGTALKRAK